MQTHRGTSQIVHLAANGYLLNVVRDSRDDVEQRAQDGVNSPNKTRNADGLVREMAKTVGNRIESREGMTGPEVGTGARAIQSKNPPAHFTPYISLGHGHAGAPSVRRFGGAQNKATAAIKQEALPRRGPQYARFPPDQV